MDLWIKGILILLGTGIVVSVLAAAVRAGKPMRRLAGSALQGLCAVGLVDVIGVFTGISLGFSWFTAAACVALGVPGVIALLLLKLLFPV